MAVIYPFRGIRYNLEVVGNLSAVVTQPYDRIGSAEEEEYKRRSPYNIVRVIGGKVPPADEAEYERRAETFRRWLKEGVLIEDPEPGIYAYWQRFEWEGKEYTRKGFVALIDLRESGVKAHERTLKGPKEDRLKLLRATEANFGHIFLLYRDPSLAASRAISGAVEGRDPEMRAVDDFGNEHLLWRITDPEVIEAAKETLAPLQAYIADGHHRFETARTFMEECFAKGWKPIPPETFTSRMVTLVNTEEPGLVIRPIHRIVHSLPDFDFRRLLTSLEEDFYVEPLDSLAAARERLAAGLGREHVFVLYAEEKFIAAALHDEEAIDRLVPGDKPSEWKRLDVSILHAAVFERILGIDAEALARQTYVDYTPYAEKAVRAVDEGKAQLAVLLNPTRVEEVLAVADRGERMPQKSTDFYPKLLTGLVAMRMRIDKG
ncbi:DUF1015 domain-containing protein [Candidatus Bipolaricaulota sp. J31]